jgi:hypothetical protein
MLRENCTVAGMLDVILALDAASVDDLTAVVDVGVPADVSFRSSSPRPTSAAAARELTESKN